MRCIFASAVTVATLHLAGTPSNAQDQSGQTEAGKPSMWAVNCSATSREAAPSCAIEQRAIVTETRQFLSKVIVRVPADTRKPVMMIQTTLGTYLPAGVSLDVDDGSPLKLGYQTCDASGCYAGSPVSGELLLAMLHGSKLNITIQALNKQPMTIPMELSGFTAAYRKIE